jgi:hypothetical protein
MSFDLEHAAILRREGMNGAADAVERLVAERDSLRGELEYASARLATLEHRIARARDIVQHANGNWLDDEELPIRPAQILDELEDVPPPDYGIVDSGEGGLPDLRRPRLLDACPMSVHAYHEQLPGYHPDQIWHDGCAECEARGSVVYRGIGQLDHRNWARAWQRAIDWNSKPDDLHISHAEMALLETLWAVYIKQDAAVRLIVMGIES